MAGFRDQFIYSVSKLTTYLPFSVLNLLARQKLILPFYHAISDLELPHIKNLYQVKNTKQFEKDLDYLLKHFQPIDYFEFLKVRNREKKLSKPSFLLSFDDGLREFYDCIAPILLRKGIPAICFLNSDFIDNKKLFFRYKASLLIEAVLANPNLAKGLFNKEDDLNSVVQQLLSIDYAGRNMLDIIADQIGLSFNDFLNTQQPYLTSEQITELIGKGFHFGAHSIDHPRYMFLSEEEQLRQTRLSVAYVSDKFSLDYKIFSFPFTDFGVASSFFKSLHSERITDHTFGCAGQKIDSAHSHTQRIPFEMAHLTAREIIHSELLYYLLKVPLGKHRIRRK